MVVHLLTAAAGPPDVLMPGWAVALNVPGVLTIFQESAAGGNVEAITAVTYVFFVYLLLALLVERSVEILVAIYKYVELKADWYTFFERRAEAVCERFERIYGFQGEQPSGPRNVLNWIYWRILVEPAEPGAKPVVSADLLRVSYIRLGTRVASLLLSFWFVLLLLNLADFNLLALIAEFYAATFAGSQVLIELIDSVALSAVLSAAIISIGTEPLHKLIRKAEDVGRTEQTAPAGGSA